MLKLRDNAMAKLMRFAASQTNIDRIALRLAWAVGAIGVVVAIVTLAILIAG